MISFKKLILAITIGLRVLSSFDAQVEARERSPKVVAKAEENNRTIKTLKKKLPYIGDGFITLQEYRSLKYSFDEIFKELNDIIKHSTDEEEVAEAKKEIKKFKEFLKEITELHQQDQKVLQRSPKLDVKNWWTQKGGVYKSETDDGKMAFAFVVKSNRNYLNKSIERTLLLKKAQNQVYHYLGSFGWSKMGIGGHKWHFTKTRAHILIMVPIENSQYAKE